MPTCLRHVEETLGLCPKAWCGELLSPRNASDGCISHRLGSGHEGPPGPRSTGPRAVSASVVRPPLAQRVLEASARQSPSGQHL